MADGAQDLSNLFSRVTALEQADVDTDQTVARIVKLYGTLGLRVMFNYHLHQYRLCGDQSPLPTIGAVCAADAFI
jgi:hypothetical protein